MPSPAPLAPEVVDIKRLHHLPLVGATPRELAVQDTMDSSCPTRPKCCHGRGVCGSVGSDHSHRRACCTMGLGNIGSL
jgi:hypothetical protein